jgi:hypothetical protein
VNDLYKNAGSQFDPKLLMEKVGFEYSRAMIAHVMYGTAVWIYLLQALCPRNPQKWLATLKKPVSP